MRISAKFKPQDLWIGAYWERGVDEAWLLITDGADAGRPTPVQSPWLSVWVCLFPMLPIKFHFGWGEGRTR